MSETVDAPRFHNTFISRSSAGVSVMDLFGGIVRENYEASLAAGLDLPYQLDAELMN